MVLEVGLLGYVVLGLGLLAFVRSPTPVVLAVGAATVGATLLVQGGHGYTAGVSLGEAVATTFGSTFVEWWGSTYWGGLTFVGNFHHDTKVVALVGLLIALVTLGGYHAVGWNTQEYLALLVLLVVAAFVSLTNDHVAVLYLSLELQALTAYTLVGYYRVRLVTAEAALKYLLIGSILSAFMLVGIFQMYGGSGSFSTGELHFDRTNGFAWLVATLLFKVGAAPFHFWGPAVYESVEWATLVALTSFAKLNLWVLMWGVLQPAVHHAPWTVALAGVASLGVGAVGGLYQTSVGGVLGYSAALNGGYLLLVGGFAGGSAAFGFFLYALTYAVVAALLGAALGVGVVDPHRPGVGVWPAAVVYYVGLNLGGLPVWPAFGAKLYLLWILSGVGLWLGILVVGASVFGVYYYVEVAAPFLFGEATTTTRATGWTPPRAATTVVALVVVVGLVLGVPAQLVRLPNVA